MDGKTGVYTVGTSFAPNQIESVYLASGGRNEVGDIPVSGYAVLRWIHVPNIYVSHYEVVLLEVDQAIGDVPVLTVSPDSVDGGEFDSDMFNATPFGSANGVRFNSLKPNTSYRAAVRWISKDKRGDWVFSNPLTTGSPKVPTVSNLAVAVAYRGVTITWSLGDNVSSIRVTVSHSGQNLEIKGVKGEQLYVRLPEGNTLERVALMPYNVENQSGQKIQWEGSLTIPTLAEDDADYAGVRTLTNLNLDANGLKSGRQVGSLLALDDGGEQGNGQLIGDLRFGATGRLFLEPSVLDFTASPGTEIIGRGIRVWESATKYAKLAYESGQAILELMGGDIRTGPGGQVIVGDDSTSGETYARLYKDNMHAALAFYQNKASWPTAPILRVQAEKVRDLDEYMGKIWFYNTVIATNPAYIMQRDDTGLEISPGSALDMIVKLDYRQALRPYIDSQGALGTPSFRWDEIYVNNVLAQYGNLTTLVTTEVDTDEILKPDIVLNQKGGSNAKITVTIQRLDGVIPVATNKRQIVLHWWFSATAKGAPVAFAGTQVITINKGIVLEPEGATSLLQDHFNKVLTDTDAQFEIEIDNLHSSGTTTYYFNVEVNSGIVYSSSFSLNTSGGI